MDIIQNKAISSSFTTAVVGGELAFTGTIDLNGVHMIKSSVRNAVLGGSMLWLFIVHAGNCQPVDQRLTWWQEARFGMFIHWGVYSIPGRGEWLLYQEHIPFQEYAKLADQFNPKQYKPKEWVAQIGRAHV